MVGCKLGLSRMSGAGWVGTAGETVACWVGVAGSKGETCGASGRNADGVGVRLAGDRGRLQPDSAASIRKARYLRGEVKIFIMRFLRQAKRRASGGAARSPCE